MVRHIQGGNKRVCLLTVLTHQIKSSVLIKWHFTLLRQKDSNALQVQPVSGQGPNWSPLILGGTENTRLMSKGITTCKALKRQENGLPLGTEGHSLLEKMQITPRTEAAAAQGRSVFFMPL